MKWQNKGHEFDHVYENIKQIKNYYLFGAGDYGNMFFELIKDEINLLAYLDNCPDKQETYFNDLPIIAPQQANCNPEYGIIITASQFARQGIIEQLHGLGFTHHKNVFMIEEFLAIYFVYKYDKVYFSNISMLPSTVCNLNCECCLNFNPFAKKPDVRPLDRVKEDIDLFFKAVDKVMLYHISGGETFLYKHVADVIEYLSVNYRKRIGSLRLITNGTVIPKDEVLEQLSHCDFEITVDDYRQAVPQYNDNFEQLIAQLEKYNIKYFINKDEFWIDLAPTTTDYSHFTENEIIAHFDTCSQSWQELRDGKLFSCNYDGYATVAGINPEPDHEVYNLRNFDKTQNKELIEFRLGYNGKGYTNLCRHCRGFRPENHVTMMPAKQKED